MKTMIAIKSEQILPQYASILAFNDEDEDEDEYDEDEDHDNDDSADHDKE